MSVPAKCTSCGDTVQVDRDKEAAVCPSCGSAFIVEKAINNYNANNRPQSNDNTSSNNHNIPIASTDYIKSKVSIILLLSGIIICSILIAIYFTEANYPHTLQQATSNNKTVQSKQNDNRQIEQSNKNSQKQNTKPIKICPKAGIGDTYKDWINDHGHPVKCKALEPELSKGWLNFFSINGKDFECGSIDIRKYNYMVLFDRDSIDNNHRALSIEIPAYKMNENTFINLCPTDGELITETSKQRVIDGESYKVYYEIKRLYRSEKIKQVIHFDGYLANGLYIVSKIYEADSRKYLTGSIECGPHDEEDFYNRLNS